MKFEKIHNKGQARLFKNPALEMLTKAHPLVIWGMYIPIFSFLIYYGATHYGLTTKTIILVFLAGAFFWSIFEYLAHRFIFHMVTETKTGKRISYILHGNHHEYPRDRQRLFMPPVPSILIAIVVFSTYFLIMGKYAFAFFPGFVVGYLLYGSMHYAIHAWNPPFKWMKPLWRNHHLHHYKDEGKGFGVSSTLWDHVFGTMFDLNKEKEDTAKVSELMFERKAEAESI